MSRAVHRFRGWRWVHDRLGYSIPIARGMWRSRFVVLAVALVALVFVVWRIRAMSAPDVPALSEAQAARVVADYLAGVRLDPWDPDEPLAPTELPPYLAAPEPELWNGRHPRDPEPRNPARADEARSHFRNGQLIAAATLFERAANAERGSWALSYHAGVSLDRAGFAERANEHLTNALTRLNSYDESSADDPVHHAIVLTTRYALGSVNLEGDCITAIRHLKLGIRSLKFFVEVEGATVFDRRLPFRVAPSSLENHDVWNRLAEAYFACEGKYPDEYFAKWGEARRFSEAEKENLVGIEEGPFPNELARCVDEGGKTSRCWALSNLHGVYYAIRTIFPDDGGAPEAFLEDLSSLARLIYNMALLAAGGEDQERALHFLALAGTLDRAEPAIDLQRPIAELGRYLAPETGNYAALAEGYRGRDLADLPFDETASPEAVKGMAWALSERWQEHLASRRPDLLTAEIDDAIRQIHGNYVESLTDWKKGAQRQLHAALAAAIDAERRRDLSRAVAIRDFRAGYLGEEWPGRASRAWWSWGLWGRVLGIVLPYLALVTALWLVHRYVVYPYLLYTADYYKTEFLKRHEARRKEGLPFTGQEIRELSEDRERI